MMPEWTIYERQKLISKHILICRQTIMPENWKVIYENHNSTLEKIFPTLTEAREFIEKHEGLMFYEGRFITRTTMSREIQFSKMSYPEWFQKKLVKEVVQKKQSTYQVGNKYGISNLTVMNYLHKYGYIFKSKHGKGCKYGEWIKS